MKKEKKMRKSTSEGSVWVTIIFTNNGFVNKLAQRKDEVSFYIGTA
jgi:hypothetical protein